MIGVCVQRKQEYIAVSSTCSKMDSIAFTETYPMWTPRICKLFPAIKFQGGTAIDVNQKFNVIERKDLNIQNDDYQSTLGDQK